MGSAVVAAGDRAEALLAGGVPDLKLTRLAVQVKRTDLEVHTDGADVTLGVRVVGEAEQQARLADAHRRLAGTTIDLFVLFLQVAHDLGTTLDLAMQHLGVLLDSERASYCS